jgi:hypothetical protein
MPSAVERISMKCRTAKQQCVGLPNYSFHKRTCRICGAEFVARHKDDLTTCRTCERRVLLGESRLTDGVSKGLAVSHVKGVDREGCVFAG